MSLLKGKKSYSKLETGKHTVVFTSMKEIDKNEVTNVDEYVMFIGTIPSEDNRPVTDVRFEKGLAKMMNELRETYFPEEKSKDWSEIISAIMNKPVDIWVSYAPNEVTGGEYTNINYEPPKKLKAIQNAQLPNNIQM